jgi:hypothetical protein
MLETLRPRLLGSLGNQRQQNERIEEWQARNRAAMTPRESYLHSVFFRATNLISVFDRLERARYFISRSPGSGRGRGFRIDRGTWTEYHFLVFTASLVTVVDCSVLLVSDAYRLGVPESHCKLDVITSNHWVKGSKAAAALRSLSKTLSEDVSRRNRYLHRGETADFGELTDPQFLKDLRMVTWVSGVADATVNAKEVAGLWKHALRELTPVLDASTQAALTGASEVFTALEQPVRQRFSAL